MKVSELIEKLLEYPQDSTLILSSDSEGNSYSPVSGMSECYYIPDSTYSGEIMSFKEAKAHAIPDEAVEAVILYPVN